MKNEPNKEIERMRIKWINHCLEKEINISQCADWWIKELSSYHNAILEEVKKLIAEEILICHQENTPTSRLTSLAMKLKKSKF